MNQTTKSKVWPTDRPFVVYMVPAEYASRYAAAQKQLLTNVLIDLGWDAGSVDLFGLSSPSDRAGAENLFFLEEIGIETRRVTLLVLWAETAGCIPNFDQLVSEECGVGKIILPATGVVLPVLRLPSLLDGWWSDPMHEAYAESVFAQMIQDGRVSLTGDEPFTFVTHSATWN